MRLALTIENATGVEQIDLTLHPSRPAIVGRSPGVQILLRSTSVSREHCRLFLRDGAAWVEDLGSSGGTFCDGTRLTGPKRLSDGDTLGIGAIRMTVGKRAEGAMTNGPSMPTQLAVPPTIRQQISQTLVVADAVGLEASQDDVAIALNKAALTIGSADDCDVVLRHVMISRKHALVTRITNGWRIEDLGSTNGTYVNGKRLDARHELKPGDKVKIGPHELRLHGDHLTARSLEEHGITIRAHALSKGVVNRSTGQTLQLLNDVSFSIKPGEFVGLLGPSGCGKSTLMDALNGRRAANAGFVYYNNDDLYQDFESYKAGIGYVPQEVIFHKALTVNQALRFTSRLRLPTDTTSEVIRENIKRVLELVGLSERGDTVIRNLSGGQKKRVSLAIELISQPTILFLDEVTSGLDLASEREVMDLMKTLSQGGLTVICITHFVDSLDRCHKLACLMRGRLVFFGSPRGFKDHFKIDAMSKVYELEKQQSPDAWEKLYRASSHYQPAPPLDDSERPIRERGRWVDMRRFRGQVVTLTSRYVRLLIADRAMPLTLIALAPLIALILCMVTSSLTYNIDHPHGIDDLRNFKQAQSVLSLGAVLTLMFLAMFGSVQEVVKEGRIYRHERSNNLMIVPYMISKLVPLSAIGLVQCAAVAAVLNAFGNFQAGTILEQTALLIATSWVGTLLGLLISTAVPAGQQDGADESGATLAVTLMNAIVIPELLFAGALAPLSNVARNIARVLISAYWSYQGFISRTDPILSDKLKLLAGVPNFDPAVAAKQLLSDPPSITWCLLVLAAHWTIACVLWFVLLLRKDGQNAFKRLYHSLPRGRIGKPRAGVALAS